MGFSLAQLEEQPRSAGTGGNPRGFTPEREESALENRGLGDRVRGEVTTRLTCAPDSRSPLARKRQLHRRGVSCTEL